MVKLNLPVPAIRFQMRLKPVDSCFYMKSYKKESKMFNDKTPLIVFFMHQQEHFG
ncbi:hypothetical protein Desgi_3187 [Desulfoscipio gibsoniae DSM 7213]|uniref:Uncharacterized protein n=1 Tax=Desulfoscipio gibsoniae DSM 7213 TaxID=767817 RepID=R4KLX2_9FIRM|nr:hypothetical protein Desgi_3187 [Desulfoscipio gibsoniae DSM 7213]